MMESIPGDVDGNTEDLTVRKKSRFKVFKSRLFGRLKKKETEGRMKQSQSTGDVTTQGGGRSEDDSEDDCLYPKGSLSSRALSHDSIFLAEQVPSSEPTRVLSQENVHSKIKALQLKLKQQNMRLAPPPLLIPGKRIEDSGTTSEDDGLPCSPPEMSFQGVAMHRANYKNPDPKKHLSWISLAGTGSEEEEQGGSSQPSSRPLSPMSPLSPKSTISSPSDLTSPFEGVDFQSPAHHLTILDNSAARHRMSIKPRNQRASTRGNRQPNMYQPKSNSMNSLDEPLSEMEETPQSVTATQAMHYSSSFLDATPAEVLLSTKMYLQEHQLDGEPQSPSNRNGAPKLTEPFLPDGRIKTNPLFLQPMPTQFLSVFSDESTSLNISDGAIEHLEEELLQDDNQYTDPIAVNDDEGDEDNATCLVNTATVTKVRTGENVTPGVIDQIETYSDDAVICKPATLLTRPNPVPAPHTKSNTFTTRNNAPPKVSSTIPSKAEKEATPFGSLDESSAEEDKSQRSSSFSITSAKYRSKIGSEQHVTRQDDESSGNALLLKNQSNNQNLTLQVENVSNTKNTDICKNAPTVPDKRTSLWREVLAQNVSKTGMDDKPEKSQECTQNMESEQTDKAEKSEDRKGLFGVKLRSTSLSLRYRSELARSEEKLKRHSLEANHMPAVQWREEQPESDSEAVRNNRKHSNPPTNVDSHQEPPIVKVSDRELSSRPLPVSGNEIESRSEPAWMSLALEKTKIHQSFCTKPSTPPTPPPNSTSSSTIQHLLRPTPHPRHLLPPSSKSQQTTCHSTELQPLNQSSQLSPSKPRPVKERWAMSSQREEKNTLDQSTHGDEQVETKGLLKPASKSSNLQQIETDQRSHSDRDQPSWMELAKRKSLAWSDKSLD